MPTRGLRAFPDEAIELTRTLSHELSPPLLIGEDLPDLLRWIANRSRELYGLTVEVEVADGVSVPDPALRVLIYQLVREHPFNVVKHAGTGEARVTADALVAGEEGENVRVVVEDGGAGFDPATREEVSRLGLPSVQERVEVVGAGWTCRRRWGRVPASRSRCRSGGDSRGRRSSG